MSENVERVLFLTSELSFRGSSILLLRLAQGLSAHGVEAIVLCTRSARFDPELTDGVRVVTVPGYSLPIWGRVVGRSILHNLEDHPPDVIHVHGPRMLPQGIALGQTLNRPVVLTLTDQSEAARLSLPAKAQDCRTIICVSESVRKALPSRYEQWEQRVIQPGVSHDSTAEVQPILQKGRTPVIGMVGPLEVLKGGSFFLRACHRVIDAGHSIRIVVVGSGPEEKNLRRLATSLELDDFITFVDDGASMSAYLSAIDIFCLPSLQQGFGIVLLEAMALGRPVIASGVGGVLDILEDESNGFIVPPSDSRALSERMQELLSDPEMAVRMGIAGHNLVEDRFTKERMVDEIMALYADVSNSNGNGNSVAAIPIHAGTGAK